MTDSAQFQWTSASCSHAGMIRQNNEDACLERPDKGLWAVADGMGGHAGGDFASAKVVEALETIATPDTLENFITDARENLQAANRELRAEAKNRDVSVIGSTVVALLAFERRCAFLWAGDSRLYRYRDGSLEQLTRDHSQAEELKSKGAAGKALRRLVRNTITRAVGAADTLELDEQTIVVKDGDMFLLCSDGLSNEVNEQDMRSALISGNCQYAAETLIDLALEHGGRDNISAVVVRAEDVNSEEKTVLNPAL